MSYHDRSDKTTWIEGRTRKRQHPLYRVPRNATEAERCLWHAIEHVRSRIPWNRSVDDNDGPYTLFDGETAYQILQSLIFAVRCEDGILDYKSRAAGDR